MKYTSIFTLIFFVTLTGCDKKTDVAAPVAVATPVAAAGAEDGDAQLKKMFVRKPEYRTFEQIQKENREKEAKAAASAQ